MMTEQEVKALADEAQREMDVEFEKASVAMKRAVEALQRFEVALLEAGVEDLKEATPAETGMRAKHQVAEMLHYVLRKIAVWPTGPAAAAAVAVKLDDCEIERAASDGKAHPPRRREVIKGLGALIDGKQEQLHRFVKRAVTDVHPKYSLETDPGGIGGAYRRVQRERDVLIHARDIV